VFTNRTTDAWYDHVRPRGPGSVKVKDSGSRSRFVFSFSWSPSLVVVSKMTYEACISVEPEFSLKGALGAHFIYGFRDLKEDGTCAHLQIFFCFLRLEMAHSREFFHAQLHANLLDVLSLRYVHLPPLQPATHMVSSTAVKLLGP